MESFENSSNNLLTNLWKNSQRSLWRCQWKNFWKISDIFLGEIFGEIIEGVTAFSGWIIAVFTITDHYKNVFDLLHHQTGEWMLNLFEIVFRSNCGGSVWNLFIFWWSIFWNCYTIGPKNGAPVKTALEWMLVQNTYPGISSAITLKIFQNPFQDSLYRLFYWLFPVVTP